MVKLSASASQSLDPLVDGEVGVGGQGDYRPSSLQLVRFVEGRVAEMTSFIGPGYLRGFEVPDHLAL